MGKGFISLSTIFWYKALKLKGSTVKGNVPVSMAYMFTPLKGKVQEKKPKGSGKREKLGFRDCTSSVMSGSYDRVDAPSLRTFQVRLNGPPDPAGDVPALCRNNYKLQSYSHGPNVYFGPIFLPCQEFRGCICWAPTLGAEGIRITQDSCTVAQSKVCERHRDTVMKERHSQTVLQHKLKRKNFFFFFPKS